MTKLYKKKKSDNLWTQLANWKANDTPEGGWGVWEHVWNRTKPTLSDQQLAYTANNHRSRQL